MSAVPPGSTHVGPYRIDTVLGRGGMGVVYRAAHRESGDVVALKTLRRVDATMLAAIRREIQALSRIRHPGIVRIVDHGDDDGIPWYAMELLEGVPLRALLEGGAASTQRHATAGSGLEPDTRPLGPSGSRDDAALPPPPPP